MPVPGSRLAVVALCVITWFAASTRAFEAAVPRADWGDQLRLRSTLRIEHFYYDIEQCVDSLALRHLGETIQQRELYQDAAIAVDPLRGGGGPAVAAPFEADEDEGKAGRQGAATAPRVPSVVREEPIARCPYLPRRRRGTRAGGDLLEGDGLIPADDVGDGAATGGEEARRVVVPVAFKGVCKGDQCPELHGRKVTLVDTVWHSLSNATFFAEETSGWVMLWWDKRFRIPVIPSLEDIFGVPSAIVQSSGRRAAKGASPVALPPRSPDGTSGGDIPHRALRGEPERFTGFLSASDFENPELGYLREPKAGKVIHM